MNDDADDLALRLNLFRLFRRGLLLLATLLLAAALVSLWVHDVLQQQFAEHVSQTVRNDLLIGNNAVALKILNQNLDGNFSRISFHDRNVTLFELVAHNRRESLFETKSIVPICLNADGKNCAAALIFHYSLLHYIPHVLLTGLFAFIIFSLVFWMFRQHVAAYYREALKHQKEAALGRLSARICHDLKLPSMIFQKVAYLDDPAQFLALRPQLQSHLQRLYAMIEKLKRADLEGLLRTETQIIREQDLHAFLASIAPHPEQLQLNMPPTLRLYLDLDKFERSLANLVLNAFQAQAQKVSVSLQVQKLDLVVSVENNGPMMPQDLVQAFLGQHHPRLLQSLGLRMVQDTVLAHGGRVDLESGPYATRFTLYFPNTVIVQEQVQPPPEIQIPPPIVSQPLIWLDEELISIACQYIKAEEREPFAFSCDAAALDSARLVISRNEKSLDQAIQKAIPMIMAGVSNNDMVWLDALRVRLRILKMIGQT